jgi:hypothetical protein
MDAELDAFLNAPIPKIDPAIRAKYMPKAEEA